MQKRAGVTILTCAVLSWILISSLSSHAQEGDTNQVVWTHGMNFKVRKVGMADFDGAKKFGAEGFHDKDLKKMVIVLDTGALGLGDATKLPPDGREPENPTLYHALELKARKPGQDKFEGAPQFGIEIFKDVNTNNLVYISETGSIAVMPAGSIKAPDKIKDPVWYHGLELKVRKAGEKTFDKAKTVSLDVYKDDNTGQLVYVTSMGQIAIVAAGDSKAPDDVKGPVWHHAFEVKVRKAKEKKFGDDTKMIAFEVYKDENTDMLIYVSETGTIAVVPAAGVKKPTESKAPTFVMGRSFRVRTHDMTDFNDKTPEHGAEIYEDVNTGLKVYVTDTGAVTVYK